MTSYRRLAARLKGRPDTTRPPHGIDAGAGLPEARPIVLRACRRILSLPLLSLLLSAALPGCAPLAPTAPDGDGAGVLADAAFAPPARPVEPAAVFALSPAMRDFLDARVLSGPAPGGTPARLVEALTSNGRLSLDYDGEFTRNAAETFDARAGHCLSLAIMTGALARAAGLSVVYRAVQVDDTWARDGDLGLYVGHVNVSIGRAQPAVRTIDHAADWWTIDFLPEAATRLQRAVPIDESRVLAMYFNNRAAEALVRQGSDEAYWWVRAAIGADPRFADAYNTLGVVYLRHGQPALAERALRAALARHDEHPQALANLAQVLRRLGRPGEADQAEARLARLRHASPFAAFARGRQAYAAGDYATARAQFERALAASNDFHEFHHWLALALLRQGETAQALWHLERAAANGGTRQQQAAYAAKLQRLRDGADPAPRAD